MEKTAVIGMGSSGMAIALAYEKEADRESYELHLYDSPESFGKGYPYRDDTETLILNLKVGKISYDYENNEDFPEWFKEKGYTKPEYAPRKTFGEYTSERLGRSIENTGAVKIHEKIVRIDKKGNLWEIETDKGRIEEYDRIHFCAGELAQKKIGKLKDEKNYFPSVYPMEGRLKNFKDISSDSRILVVGTGLTAVDTVTYLLKETHEKNITMYSGSGIIPTVRVAPSDIKINVLTMEKLTEELNNNFGRIDFKRFQELFEEELKSHGIDYESFLKTHMKGGIEGIRYNIDNPEILSKVQALLPPMNVIFNKVWDSMKDSDRIEFRKKYHPFMCLNRSPLPLESAEILLKGEDEGKLKLIRGRADVEAKDDGRFQVVYSSGDPSEEFDFVINATGLDVFFENSEDKNPLLYELLDKRYFMKDKWGGFTLNPIDMTAISPLFGSIKNLHSYGVLASGVQYRNNSTLIIQHTAHRVVRKLIEDGFLKPGK